MRLLYLLLLLAAYTSASAQQPNSPCLTDPVYRQFDFWIGEWEVYAKSGKKAGDSRIEVILDSCIILENWTSASGGYAGKSFNTYNAVSGQWQQTWVDNRGAVRSSLKGGMRKVRSFSRPSPIHIQRILWLSGGLHFITCRPIGCGSMGKYRKTVPAPGALNTIWSTGV